MKCVIDEMLDIVENVTDGLWNGLKPLLGGSSANANAMMCASGLKTLGFCVP